MGIELCSVYRFRPPKRRLLLECLLGLYISQQVSSQEIEGLSSGF